jgi:hypothetical protein
MSMCSEMGTRECAFVVSGVMVYDAGREVLRLFLVGDIGCVDTVTSPGLWVVER